MNSIALHFMAFGGKRDPMKKLRIIQVVNVRWFNATAWYALTLGRLLAKAGHEVLALVLPETETAERARGMGCDCLDIDINSVNPFTSARQLLKLNQLVKDFQPDIVNCHRGEGMILWGMLRAFGAHFALVRTRGDQRPPKPNFANRFLHTKLADALIATNSRTARQCRELLGLQAEHVHVIAGGVDRTVFRPVPSARAEVRQQYAIADDEIVVGLLGRFDPVKGHRELMEAFAKIHARYDHDGGPRLRLMLVGHPANISTEQMQSLADSLQISRHTIITGKVDNVVAYINAMDVGVIASQGSEAIARAAFEIMSCGVPLIGTDVGVMPDLLAPHALAECGNESGLVRLLERVVADENFRLHLQKEQQEHMGIFSHACFLEQTLAVYGKVLGLPLGRHPETLS